MIPPVLELLPHRGSAVLLDRLTEVSEEGCRGEYTVVAECPYLDAQGQLPGWAGLEVMAQAASAFSGYRHRLAGQPIRVGYLLGARHVPVSVPAFPVGTVLEVEVRVIFLDEAGPSAFNCELRHLGERVSHAALKAIERP